MEDALESDALVSNWVSLDSARTEESSKSVAPTPTTPTQIVEAQGWVKTPDGTVMLTPQALTVIPQSPWFNISILSAGGEMRETNKEM